MSDPALHASDGMEDLKSIESTDAEPLAEETNPISIKSIENVPEKLAGEGNDNSTTMEDLVQEPEKLTTQEGNTEAEAIEDKDYLKLNRDSEGDQGNVDAGSFGGDIGNVEAGSSGGDQGNVEARSFGGDQSSDAFTSSAVESERVIEQSLAGVCLFFSHPKFVLIGSWWIKSLSKFAYPTILCRE